MMISESGGSTKKKSKSPSKKRAASKYKQMQTRYQDIPAATHSTSESTKKRLEEMKAQRKQKKEMPFDPSLSQDNYTPLRMQPDDFYQENYQLTDSTLFLDNVNLGNRSVERDNIVRSKDKFVEFYNLCSSQLNATMKQKETCEDILLKLKDVLTTERQEHLYDPKQTLSKLKAIHNIFSGMFMNFQKT